MPDAKELRQQAQEARARMGRTIAGAAGAWEELVEGDDGEAWSVRATAEHALSVELDLAGAVAAVIGVDAPAKRELALGSAEEALAALSEVERDVQSVLAGVGDADLEKASPVLGNLYATLVLETSHMNLHALQIAER